MSNITKGSTKLIRLSSSLSVIAITKDIVAANKRILTRRSSNCSFILSQRGVFSSSSSSLVPYSTIFLYASYVDNP